MYLYWIIYSLRLLFYNKPVWGILIILHFVENFFFNNLYFIPSSGLAQNCQIDRVPFFLVRSMYIRLVGISVLSDQQ